MSSKCDFGPSRTEPQIYISWKTNTFNEISWMKIETDWTFQYYHRLYKKQHLGFKQFVL